MGHPQRGVVTQGEVVFQWQHAIAVQYCAAKQNPSEINTARLDFIVLT